MGWTATRCSEVVLDSPIVQMFRQMLFARVVPNLKRLGLLTPARARGASSELEHHPVRGRRPGGAGPRAGPGLTRGPRYSRAGSFRLIRRRCPRRAAPPRRMRQRPGAAVRLARSLKAHREGRDGPRGRTSGRWSREAFASLLPQAASSKAARAAVPRTSVPVLRARAGTTPASRDGGAGAIGRAAQVPSPSRTGPLAPSSAGCTPLRSLKRAVPASAVRRRPGSHRGA